MKRPSNTSLAQVACPVPHDPGLAMVHRPSAKAVGEFGGMRGANSGIGGVVDQAGWR